MRLTGARGRERAVLRAAALARPDAVWLPAHAVSIEPGSWALETEIGYQNTWALSPEVERYLTSLEPTGRRRIGPNEVQAIRGLPGENYLLDLETALFDMTFHYKLSRD